MTISQITSVLQGMGYSLDTWIPLNEVPIIFLDQDGRIYSNKKTTRFNFGSDSILRIAFGREDSNGIFTDVHGNTENFKSANFFDFKKIFGFIKTTEVGALLRYLPKPISN